MGCKDSDMTDAKEHAHLVCHDFPFKKHVSFNFMATVTVCSDFGAKHIKPVSVSTFSPSICCEVMGLDAMILVTMIPNSVLAMFTSHLRFHSSSICVY